jgi:hypothetical protein
MMTARSTAHRHQATKVQLARHMCEPDAAARLKKDTQRIAPSAMVCRRRHACPSGQPLQIKTNTQSRLSVWSRRLAPGCRLRSRGARFYQKLCVVSASVTVTISAFVECGRRCRSGCCRCCCCRAMLPARLRMSATKQLGALLTTGGGGGARRPRTSCAPQQKQLSLNGGGPAGWRSCARPPPLSRVC